MKRFEFKLQPLLNYREYLERIAQQNMARAHMDVKNCEKQITSLKQTYDQHADKTEQIIQEGISAFEFKRYHHYLESVERGIEDEKAKKIKLRKTLTEKLLELKKKSVDKKAMELYREKLKIQYTQEVIKIEQKELDEISSLKKARAGTHETV